MKLTHIKGIVTTENMAYSDFRNLYYAIKNPVDSTSDLIGTINVDANCTFINNALINRFTNLTIIADEDNEIILDKFVSDNDNIALTLLYTKKDFATKDDLSVITEIGSIYRQSEVTSLDWLLYTNITEMPDLCLRSTSTLTSIIFPTTIEELSTNVFVDCSSLTSITFLATTPPTISTTYGNSTFEGLSNYTIYVPSDYVDTYKNATGWSNYADKIQAISE